MEGENTPLPHMDEDYLRMVSNEVAMSYRELIREFYELAAMIQLTVVLFGSKDNVKGAIIEWEHYLYCAEGHSDQKDRIKIAKEQLEKLRSGSFG